MKKIFLVICSMFMLSITNLRAEEYETQDYFPLDVGNKWTYQIDSKKNDIENNYEESAAVMSKEELNGKKVYLYAPDYVTTPILYLGLKQDGIYMYKIGMDKSYIMFSQPEKFLPDRPRIGQKLYSTVSMKVYDANGSIIDEGSIQTKLAFYGAENVFIGSTKIENCLKFSRLSIIKSKKNLLITEEILWFAKHIGAIKEKHRLLNRRDGGTDRLYSKKQLKHASIKGKAFEY